MIGINVLDQVIGGGETVVVANPANPLDQKRLQRFDLVDLLEMRLQVLFLDTNIDTMTKINQDQITKLRNIKITWRWKDKPRICNFSSCWTVATAVNGVPTFHMFAHFVNGVKTGGRLLGTHAASKPGHFVFAEQMLFQFVGGNGVGLHGAVLAIHVIATVSHFSSNSIF